MVHYWELYEILSTYSHVTCTDLWPFLYYICLISTYYIPDYVTMRFFMFLFLDNSQRFLISSSAITEHFRQFCSKTTQLYVQYLIWSPLHSTLFEEPSVINRNTFHCWSFCRIFLVKFTLGAHYFLVFCKKLKGLSHQIFMSFLSSTILNQYFLYGRKWFRIFFIQGFILIFKDEVLMYMTQNAS